MGNKFPDFTSQFEPKKAANIMCTQSGIFIHSKIVSDNYIFVTIICFSQYTAQQTIPFYCNNTHTRIIYTEQNTNFVEIVIILISTLQFCSNCERSQFGWHSSLPYRFEFCYGMDVYDYNHSAIFM